MFRVIKSQAKKQLRLNYKQLIIPCFLFMLSIFAIDLIINYFTAVYYWIDYTDFLRLFILLLYVFFEFVAFPVSISCIFKAILISEGNDTCENKGFKSFLSLSNIKTIVLINLVPRLLSCVFRINRSNVSVFKIYSIEKPALIILSLISVFISYKFFAVNYCFALSESSFKKTLVTSFKTMRRLFFKWILLGFSFFPWALLVGVINALIRIVIEKLGGGSITNAVDLYVPFLDSFGLSFGYGIDFYITPYMYLTIYNFLSERNSKIRDVQGTQGYGSIVLTN